ncbi:restriction endonuclease subunit S [Enterococcus lactis]|nr:restriction endonuclease subunit S [Enterococcus lactis]
MKFKLSDLADYVTEKIDIESIDLDTYISTDNMLSEKQGVSIIEKLPNVKRVTRFKKGDTLVSNIRPYFKKIWFANRDGGCSADVLVFRVKDKVKPEFLFCLLFQDYFFNRMVLSSKGTKMPRGDKKAIMETSFEITELENQEKISKIFFDFKEKIELNNQMIATLEELAATLFKRWFVDFEFPDENGKPYKSSGGKMVSSELGEIPEGWEVSHLKNIATIIMGQSPKGASYNTEGKGLPLINGASDFKNGIITPQKFTTEPKKVTQPKDLIFGVRATIGGTVEVEREYAIGRGAGIARAKEDEFREYLFLTMNNLFNFFSETATGSVYINISRKDFEDYGLVRPSSNTIELFHKLMEPIFNQISDSRNENNSLTAIRNALLPKLLSGDLDV